MLVPPRGGLIEWEGGKEKGGEEGEGNKRETWRKRVVLTIGILFSASGSEGTLTFSSIAVGPFSGLKFPVSFYSDSTGEWHRVHSNAYNVLVPLGG